MSRLESLLVDQTPVVRLENHFLRVDVAPGIGGRIVHVQDKGTGYEFLWHNERLRLERSAPGSAYDPHFYGGVDEVLPSDVPEFFNGVMNADHGELWTLPLDSRMDGDALALAGVLPSCGLAYERRLSLKADEPVIFLDYRLENRADGRRIFLWKMHAALHIEPGDQIVCPARKASVADPQWSRWGADEYIRDVEPFSWPCVGLGGLSQTPHCVGGLPEGTVGRPRGQAVTDPPLAWGACRPVPASPWSSSASVTDPPLAWGACRRADLIPPPDGTTDFIFLYDLQDGTMGWRSHSRGLEFTVHFDRRVFPYACYFASYGGLDGHYTAILEPCTAMPVSVNEAARLGQCSSLEPGEQIVTRVTIYAGPVRV